MGSTSQGLSFSVSPLSHLEQKNTTGGAVREGQHPRLQPGAARFLPDFEALEETVGIFLLVGLLTDDGPEPPGIVDHRAEPVTCAAGAEVNNVREPHTRAWLQRRCSDWPCTLLCVVTPSTEMASLQTENVFIARS